jgi:hypothetical protein
MKFEATCAPFFLSFVNNYRPKEPKEHETLFASNQRVMFLGSFSMEKSKFSRSNDSPGF